MKRNRVLNIHLFDRFVRCSFCFLLIFSMMFMYTYEKPVVVHASEVEIGVAVDEALTAAMKALGIGVAGTVTAPMYKTILEHLKTSAVMTAFEGCTGAVVGGKTIYNLTTKFLTEVGNQIKATYDTALANYESNTLLNNIPATLQSNMSYNKYCSDLFTDLGLTGYTFTLYNGEKYNEMLTAYKVLSVLPYPVVSDQIYTSSVGANTFYYEHTSQGILVKQNINYSWDVTHFQPMIPDTSLGYVIAFKLYGNDSWIYFCTSGLMVSGSNSNAFQMGVDTAIPSAPGKDVYGTDVDKWFADGYSALNNSVSDVVGRVGDAVGVTGQDGTKSIPVSIPVGSDTDVEKGRTATQSTTTGKDIATTDDKTKDAATNTGKDTTPSGDKLIDVTNGFPTLNNALNDGLNNFKQLFSFLSDFFKFLAKCFSYLPSYLGVIFVAIAVVAIIIRIFGRRGGG